MRFANTTYVTSTPVFLKMSRLFSTKPEPLHGVRPVEPGPEECCQVIWCLACFYFDSSTMYKYLPTWEEAHFTCLSYMKNGCITCVWEVYREEMNKWESENMNAGLQVLASVKIGDVVHCCLTYMNCSPDFIGLQCLAQIGFLCESEQIL
jgi:hypothetical protein